MVRTTPRAARTQHESGHTTLLAAAAAAVEEARRGAAPPLARGALAATMQETLRGPLQIRLLRARTRWWRRRAAVAARANCARAPRAACPACARGRVGGATRATWEERAPTRPAPLLPSTSARADRPTSRSVRAMGLAAAATHAADPGAGAAAAAGSPCAGCARRPPYSRCAPAGARRAINCRMPPRGRPSVHSDGCVSRRRARIFVYFLLSPTAAGCSDDPAAARAAWSRRRPRGSPPTRAARPRSPPPRVPRAPPAAAPPRSLSPCRHSRRSRRMRRRKTRAARIPWWTPTSRRYLAVSLAGGYS